MKNGSLTKIWTGYLLCLPVVITGCCIQIGCSIPLANYEREVQLSAPLPPAGVFKARTNDGAISIAGADSADCNVTATIITKAESTNKAKKIAEDTKVKLVSFGNKLILKVEKPILIMSQSVDVKFKATVPESCSLELGTDDGDITVENVEGNFDIKTDDGTVMLSQVGGVITVGSDDGSITCQDITGDIQLKSDDGNIKAVYSEKAEHICNVFLVTDDGDIDFTAPSNFSAAVEVLMDDGSISTDLPIKMTGKLDNGITKGTIGTGEGKLHIKTDDGSITIK